MSRVLLDSRTDLHPRVIGTNPRKIKSVEPSSPVSSAKGNVICQRSACSVFCLRTPPGSDRVYYQDAAFTFFDATNWRAFWFTITSVVWICCCTTGELNQIILFSCSVVFHYNLKVNFERIFRKCVHIMANALRAGWDCKGTAVLSRWSRDQFLWVVLFELYTWSETVVNGKKRNPVLQCFR